MTLQPMAISCGSLSKETGMTTPTLDEMIQQLKDLTEVAEIDPDVPLAELSEIDSLDLMEWVYQAQERYALAVDESVFEDFDGSSTLRRLFERVMATAEAASTPA